MKVSAWLTLELRQPYNWQERFEVYITGARQTRPLNKMAVKVTLDIDPDDIQPQIEALVEAGHIQLEIEEPEEDED